jgi:hypothetical protein
MSATCHRMVQRRARHSHGLPGAGARFAERMGGAETIRQSGHDGTMGSVREDACAMFERDSGSNPSSILQNLETRNSPNPIAIRSSGIAIAISGT